MLGVWDFSCRGIMVGGLGLKVLRVQAFDFRTKLSLMILTS